MPCDNTLGALPPNPQIMRFSYIIWVKKRNFQILKGENDGY